MTAGLPRRLLLTRPREDSEPLAAALAGRGIEALIEPLLRITMLPGPAPALDGVQALLVTSANGIRAFAAREARRDVAVYAVGDATARVAAAAGFTKVESAGGDVGTLAALVRRRLTPEGGALLHVAGSALAGDLAGALQRAGFAYRRSVLYRAETARALSPAAIGALAEGRIAGVVLYSPRTARLFCRLASAAGLAAACSPLTAFCLSEAVATAAALPWQHRLVAARPDQAAMIDAVVAALGVS